VERIPWHKGAHPECAEGQVAVIKDADGSLAGCHDTEGEADAQLAALYASEGEGDGAAMQESPAPSGGPRVEQVMEVAEVGPVDLGDGHWEGVIAVEGVPTGDGRQFAPNALRWQDLPLTLTYQPPSHGGMSTDGLEVGTIEKIYRDGNLIRASGRFDLEDPEALKIAGKVARRVLRGVSVDVDDTDESDIELVFPDAPSDPDAPEDEVVMMGPELMIFHSARIRGAALTSLPAFIEAYVQVVGQESPAPSGTGLVAAIHHTDVVDRPWDNAAYLRRLPDALTVAHARTVFSYVDPTDVEEGVVRRDDYTNFLHHHVGPGGSAGPANLSAVTRALGSIAEGNHPPEYVDMLRMTYEHLAAHLRDDNREPLPFLVAGGAAVDVYTPPLAVWFADPHLTDPTPITVTDDGRVYGHAARWDQCHIGFGSECVTPPREHDYSYFRTGEVVCAGGERVAVGQITLGTGHAPLSYGASAASSHYDDTGTAVADVSVGSDRWGIWVAGVVRDGVDERRVRQLRASGQVSGDWRRVAGSLRLVGLLAVNVPGFPVPRTRARVASGTPIALVAAGALQPSDMMAAAKTDAEVDRALRRAMQRVAAGIGRDDASRREALIARVRGG
jgi:hypothetical protein